MKNWNYINLSEAVSSKGSNLSLKKIRKSEGKFDVFGAKGFVGRFNEYGVDVEYISIIKDGAGVGRIMKQPAKSSVLATMQYLIPKKNFHIDFVKYFLNSIDFKRYISGSTIPHIYFKDYKKEKIPDLKLQEQEAIVTKLDQVFKAIDQAKANIEQNMVNAEELFQSQLNQIFSQTGEGWEEKKLGDISEIMYGYTSKTSPKYSIKYLRITDIKDNNVDWEKVPCVNVQKDDLKKYQLYKGDILFARTGATTGKSYQIKETIPDRVFASYLIRVKCLNTSINPEFLYLYFKTGDYWQKINQGISGSAQGGFNASKLKMMKIKFPKNLEKQSELIKYSKKIEESKVSLIIKYQQKLESLEELKQSILEKAFQGELV